MSLKKVKIIALLVDMLSGPHYSENMSQSNLSQVLGIAVCVGAFVVITLVGIASRYVAGQRSRSAGPNGPAIRPFNANPADDDFGGVPTTGPVQDYERDYPPEPLIGSSGFDAQGNEEKPEEEED